MFPGLVQIVGQVIHTHLPCSRAIYAVTLAVAMAVTVLPWPARAMVINLTYDSSVTGDPNAAQIEAAYGQVVANFETLYTNPITINITVYWGNYGLGQSSTSLQGYNSYSQLTSALQAAETTPEDASAVASLPPSDPTPTGNWAMPRAEIKALPSLASFYSVGPNDSVDDGDVYFDSGVTWTFNPTSRAVPGAYDFMAVAEHETSEVMGRVYGLNPDPSTGYYLPYDLFRFLNGARTINASDTGVYFSVNDGVTELKPFNYDPSGDLQDWAPTNLPDSFDWEIGSDTEGFLSSADLTALDVLGYDLNFTPPKVKGARLANGNFELTFTNVSGLGFTVWASTNLLTPATNWANLGMPTETAVGHYQFIDTTANKTRFYRVGLQ